MGKVVAKVFISHSRADKEMRDYFLKIFGLAGVEATAVEFENFPPPPWRYIKNEMLISDALFLLLGPNVIDRGIFTQNWISFEIGLACELGKEVWVFEQYDIPVHFPIPYLDNYVLYDPGIGNHLDYIRSIVQAYKIFPILRTFPNIYTNLTCPNEKCGVEFNLCTEIKRFDCPSCRKPIVIQ